ncbi:YkgJ family cysteine cluster protein [Rubripirellula reticaptiva]|uniref:Flagellin N-methylase n=1 Tax=Rubripirellula reticaptiva TaxID=2528013 RepID=A0A5C6FDX6_9BACT|nr:YkgJ family cysteine cluster protein [Rubripirellula reticaptiva]TWU57829.1 Flagellin N-methylase [Rubripirellula reticaptiva]
MKLPTIEDCGDCGVCCMHMGYPPYLRGENGGPVEEYWTTMPADLKREWLAYVESYDVPDDELDGPCVWLDLDTKRCKHHESRPSVCRDFRVGSQGCRDWRTAYGLR